MSFVKDFSNLRCFWFENFDWLQAEATLDVVMRSTSQALSTTFIQFYQYRLCRAKQYRSLKPYLLVWPEHAGSNALPILIKEWPEQLGFQAAISCGPAFKQAFINCLVPELYPDFGTAEALYNLMSIGDI